MNAWIAIGLVVVVGGWWLLRRRAARARGEEPVTEFLDEWQDLYQITIKTKKQ